MYLSFLAVPVWLIVQYSNEGLYMYNSDRKTAQVINLENFVTPGRVPGTVPARVVRSDKKQHHTKTRKAWNSSVQGGRGKVGGEKLNLSSLPAVKNIHSCLGRIWRRGWRRYRYLGRDGRRYRVEFSRRRSAAGVFLLPLSAAGPGH